MDGPIPLANRLMGAAWIGSCCTHRRSRRGPTAYIDTSWARGLGARLSWYMNMGRFNWCPKVASTRLHLICYWKSISAIFPALLVEIMGAVEIHQWSSTLSEACITCSEMIMRSHHKKFYIQGHRSMLEAPKGDIAPYITALPISHGIRGTPC